MNESGFDTRVKINQIIENQIPEFLISESPKFTEFLKQYYISQEYQGGSTDIVENLDQYLNLNNFTQEIINGKTLLLNDISADAGIAITVTSTKGFPSSYGLLKIDDEIITYTGITTNTFTGCIRGFSGITSYNKINDPEELEFSTSKSSSHLKDSTVINLSALFLKEFYKKIKYKLTPGLENTEFVNDLDINNFIKEAKSLYQAKGTKESFRILFNILYGETPTVFDLENLIIKPSDGNFIRREVIIAELLNPPANPINLQGQTITKSTDSTMQGAVSEVEILSRKNKTYYKLSLFVGYNDINESQAQFTIHPKTKVLESVSIGSSIISVDSTIGFDQIGKLISGSNIITYTDKSVNQFFGCSGVNFEISTAADIRSDEVVYGYENGDTTKKVELRITGVLSKFIPTSEIYYAEESDIISVKNLGKIIKNPTTNPNYTEIFANSWIYNTSSRYQIQNISGSTFTLSSTPDKSSLKVNDNVDIVVRGTQNVVAYDAIITNINVLNNQIILTNLGSFSPSISLDYDLRRKLKKSSSSGVQLEFGNNNIISDVQNLYVDGDEYAYVSSNSLPSYTITKSLLESVLPEATGSPSESNLGLGYLQGYDLNTLKYSQICFETDVNFISGDAIVYESNNPIPGLTSGKTYYVEVLSTRNKIRLYDSKSFVGGGAYLEFDPLPSGSGSHRFILFEQKTKFISPQKLLRKFPLQNNLKKSSTDITKPGSIGMLINGVEIISPKSNDKLYYGPIESIKILNSGKNYDVINPPNLVISSTSTSIGTTALAKVVVKGSVKNVTVDPQDFDLNTVFSASIVGGNGSGAILEPIVSRRYRELEFDARPILNGGGIDSTNETITFKTSHNFLDGESIVYNSNGNLPIGIGTFGTNITTENLGNGAIYYAKYVNSSTIRLYKSFDNYLAGINTVGITTINNSGVHKFRTLEKNTLRSIKILNSGENYENRQLYVKPTGISTFNNTITFNNHNFNDGEIINYRCTGNLVSGLSTANNYYISKIDNNTFRLCDAGIGTISQDNFIKKKFVRFSSIGSGYHIFKYPDISVIVNVSYGGTIIQQISATPRVLGSISDVYVYENGTGYGSNSIINLKQSPKLTLKTGQGAELTPFIRDGKIVKVDVLSKGSEYFSIPDLVVEGSGIGAVIRPVIQDQKIVDTVIINSGIGYTQTDVRIRVVPAGSGALLDCNIRPLTINKQYRFGKEFLNETDNNLQYSWIGYDYDIAQTIFGEELGSHSPLIGWAYDGNPIYGPYGYSNPEDNNSPIKLLTTGYVLNTSNVFDRPNDFNPGFFIEDYSFNSSGDLDYYNGRYCKTPEFPFGTYAYFVGVSTDLLTNNLYPSYPYFIGNSYRSSLVQDNLTLNQSFDFNNSNLVRNTFPYKVNDPYADNDFIIESNEIINQTSNIESVSNGSIDSLVILESGSDYKIGDLINFDDEGTEGSGLSASVSSLTGKSIQSIITQTETYNNVVFEWNGSETVVAYFSPYHSLLNNDNITISGLSTSVLNLAKHHQIGVTTERTVLFDNIPSNSTPRAVVDLYVSRIPTSVAIGSSIVIENETLEVLNLFYNNSIIRARRSDVGSAHSISANVDILPNKFTIPVKTNYFDSTKNDKVYFNPKQSVGIGTTVGGSISVNYTVGVVTSQISIPTQSLYLPNHPFKTGQKVTLNKFSSTSAFSVSNTSSGTNFTIPFSGNSQTLYVINKTKDYIGLTTSVGLTTNTNGLFFITNGSDNYEYFLQSNNSQVIGNVFKIRSTVSVSEPHGLLNGDLVNMQVNPILSVGVGQSSKVILKYDDTIQNVLVNPIGFNSSAINIDSNIITISSHQLKTGDKVFYKSTGQIASGLSTGSYFVYKIDNDKFQLTETLLDSNTIPPNIVNIVGVGGSRHEISLINPQLLSVKNNNLVFDVSHSSLLGRKLKFYYDKEFTSEFISIGNSTSFNISGFGTIGVSTTSTITLNYSSDFPSTLYYSLEKSGSIANSDIDVENYSQISFVDSAYVGTYNVSGIATTSFTISLSKIPEKSSYISSECSNFNYTTNSINSKGGIDKAKIIFGGYGYKKLPKFLNISSSEGKNANIVGFSTSIGKINKIRILNSGFEYSSDKTLKPEAYISPFVSIINSNTVKDVHILSGGKNYSIAPSLVIKNPVKNTIVNDNSLKCNIYSGSISSVEIISPIYGLESIQHEIVPIDNSNGVGISSVISSNSGIVTCILSTPILGFSTSANPFSTGDKILVENIQSYGSSGDGFNSKDYNYSYFTVVSYLNTNPAILVYDMSDFSTNPGFASTVQSTFPSVSNKKNLPEFEVVQDFSTFNIGEQLLVNTESGFQLRDVYIQKSTESYIKVKGLYELSIGEIIKGKNTGVIATISDIKENKGQFNIDYSLYQNYGWLTNSGKLNDSNQVSSDNDYYQNLSYTIKSSIEFENIVNPVNRLLHTAGLKNFADLQVKSKPSVAYGITSYTNDLITLDLTEEKRVDSINNFDMTLDLNTFEGKSKFLKLKNKKLSSYINCISNRVLLIDDISNLFSNGENLSNLFANVSSIEDSYYKYLVQVTSAQNSNIQVSDLIVLSNDNDAFTLEKSTLTNTEKVLGTFIANNETKSLQFYPTDPYDSDYNIKILQHSFNSTVSGINTQNVGFINLIGINTSVGIGTTVNVLSFNKNKVTSLFANIQIINNSNNTMNYVELFASHDGTNTYLTEYYFDTNGGISTNFIGLFNSSIVGNNFYLSFYNDEKSSVLLRNKIVGFGTTSVGIGTYRFILPGQIDDLERTSYYESKYSKSSSIVNIIGVSTETVSTIKSLVRVSYGNTSALHQILTIQDKNDIYTLQYPFLSIGSTSGIGTFGGEFLGNQAILKFYPDNNLNILDVQSFNEILYTENDNSNIPPDLVYGPITEKLSLSYYYGINGSNANKLNFDLKYKGNSIYAKQFNPSNTTELNKSTGTFTIRNHFFSTGEKLIYTPNSTFLGITAAAVGIGSTLNSSGIVTNILPSEVYAISINADQFKLSTRKDYALAGIYVTFTSSGLGNAHQLEMSKKLEKTVISINGVVQSPITYANIIHTLKNNSTYGIGVGDTIFSISGISSIRMNDILKIDDEYVKVLSVGIGTTSSSEITGIGTFNLVKCERGFVGSIATTHIDNSNVSVYRGSYNIVNNKIYFTEAPRGKGGSVAKNASNLLEPFAKFGGRVYLRNDYTTNVIYDDISNQFNGIGQTYTLKVQGINTSLVESGNGLLFINDVFQTPTTSNNIGNNYELIKSAGISSVVFTGITSSNGQIITSDFDINQNQLPRGGIIISLGSTPGLGFAPLVGAKVKAKIGVGGSITSITGISYTGAGKNVSTAFYNNQTGIVEITTTQPHELVGGDLIKLVGLAFTCESSSGVTSYFPLSGLSGSYGVVGISSATSFNAFVGYSSLPHTYVGLGTIFAWYNLNHGSGYRNPVSIAITDSNHTGTPASISAIVGAGGTLNFIVTNGGSGYSTSTTIVSVSEPSYENLPIIGVSRVGVGSTTESGKNLLVTLNVGASSTVGIGSTLFEVTSFKISRPGYAFKIGDVFRPVGLVTDKNLSSPISQFELTVLDTFTDSFSSWQFGELDYIDSIKNLQDGQRVRFPLYYNSRLLGFQKEPDNIIDLNAVLLIFINGIIQEPGYAYQFEGGTSFTFTTAPNPEDDISIFFYRGTRGDDSVQVSISETIKIGDFVQVYKNDSHINTVSQDVRRVDNISSSDTIETNLYTYQGVDSVNYKPFTWTKQKVDRIINGDYVYKSRDSLETQVYPTAKIIKSFSSTDSSIFVDDAQFFNYEENNYSIAINDFNALIIPGVNLVSAGLTAIVSAAGTIESLNITNSGSGYIGTSLDVKISAPKNAEFGIGSTASATVSIVNGSISTPITITNPGFGYTYLSPPQVIVNSPQFSVENIQKIETVEGFSGIITGITTSTGVGGHPLALKFFLNSPSFTGLNSGYPIYIFNTRVGNGLTSVDSNNTQIVGIGTTYVDNIYYIHSISTYGSNAEIKSNILSTTNISGINTVGLSSLGGVGRFSWGRFSNFTRSNPISIAVTGFTVDSGLTTFPTIQRRNYGYRDTGALRKNL